MTTLTKLIKLVVSWRSSFDQIEKGKRISRETNASFLDHNDRIRNGETGLQANYAE